MAVWCWYARPHRCGSTSEIKCFCAPMKAILCALSSSYFVSIVILLFFCTSSVSIFACIRALFSLLRNIMNTLNATLPHRGDGTKQRNKSFTTTFTIELAIYPNTYGHRVQSLQILFFAPFLFHFHKLPNFIRVFLFTNAEEKSNRFSFGRSITFKLSAAVDPREELGRKRINILS